MSCVKVRIGSLRYDMADEEAHFPGTNEHAADNVFSAHRSTEAEARLKPLSLQAKWLSRCPASTDHQPAFACECFQLLSFLESAESDSQHADTKPLLRNVLHVESYLVGQNIREVCYRQRSFATDCRVTCRRQIRQKDRPDRRPEELAKSSKVTWLAGLTREGAGTRCLG